MSECEVCGYAGDWLAGQGRCVLCHGWRENAQVSMCPECGYSLVHVGDFAGIVYVCLDCQDGLAVGLPDYDQ